MLVAANVLLRLLMFVAARGVRKQSRPIYNHTKRMIKHNLGPGPAVAQRREVAVGAITEDRATEDGATCTFRPFLVLTPCSSGGNRGMTLCSKSFQMSGSQQSAFLSQTGAGRHALR